MEEEASTSQDQQVGSPKCNLIKFIGWTESSIQDLRFELEKIFTAYCLEKEVTLESVEIVGVRRSNFLADIVHCTVRGTKIGSDPKEESAFHFIAKEIPRDEKYVAIYNCSTAFINEKIAYSHIIPTLNKFAPKKLPVPECIHASDKLIIVEDLTDSGYIHFDKLTGFTVEMVKKILHELANLHAASLIMSRKDPELFKTISGETVEEVLFKEGKENHVLLETQERSIDMVIQIAEKHITTPDCLDKFLELKGRTRELQLELLTRRGPNAVVNHGDLWASNIMVRGEDTKLIDFQIMRHTSVAADLNYFFYVNLDPDFRVAHKDEFLEYYLEELHRNVEGAGLQISDELSMEWLNKEMKQYSLFGFICGLWVLPVFYHTVELMEKSEEAFVKQNSLSIQSMIDNMVPEQKDRLTRLILSYAVSN